MDDRKSNNFFFTIRIKESRMIDDTQQYTAKRPRIKEKLWIVEMGNRDKSKFEDRKLLR